MVVIAVSQHPKQKLIKCSLGLDCVDAPLPVCRMPVAHWVVPGADPAPTPACLEQELWAYPLFLLWVHAYPRYEYILLPTAECSWVSNLMQESKQCVDSSFLPQFLLHSRTVVWHLELPKEMLFLVTFFFVCFAKEVLTVSVRPSLLHTESQGGLCCSKKLSGPIHGDHNLFLESP